ncbi:DUF1643 domain-containing protein [Flavivirga abyssicola]|uniref:DUF1643 domain-containing protein n=1 Tax=Flavivirga abyssicola TaxID=3063533 RepID=UPI0026DFCD33|nr:DUF1643 domain-containing protein [Flavivirga sp. MEBiC07777]WVK13959.1 DUF1643 domain-containing protein [Flavivirga sp. MEBiC07777]
MKKPTYKYPDFVTKVELKSENGKRYWLNLVIDKNKSGGITIILKNPSRADKLISDKTVFNVSNYIYRNREKYSELENVGQITILNLIPNYLTDSNGLKEFKETIVNQENIWALNKFCQKNKNVIIAWGNHPIGLYHEYEQLKTEVKKILTGNKNQVFYVDRLTNAGNPKHGQVWGYENKLKKLTEF